MGRNAAALPISVENTPFGEAIWQEIGRTLKIGFELGEPNPSITVDT